MDTTINHPSTSSSSTTIPLTGPALMPVSGLAPKQCVILLHGLGADGNDLFSLVPELTSTLPDAAFIAPNAPFDCDMAPFGYQWFSMQDLSDEAILAGVQQAVPSLNHFIDTQLEHLQLDDSHLILIGFSQGTIMSLYTALRRPYSCAGIIGFSGALISPHLTAVEMESRPPVCLIHGEADEILPCSELTIAEHALKQADIPVESHLRPGLGHGIDPEGLEIAKKFLKKQIVA